VQYSVKALTSGRFSAVRGPNCIKFGDTKSIAPSSTLTDLVSDFRYHMLRVETRAA